MKIAEYFNSDNAMSLSGVLVALLVGALSVYTVSGSSLWPWVAIVSAVQLLCFVAFVSISNRSNKVLATLLWAQAIAIIVLYFLVINSFVAILSILWIVQATGHYGPRRAYWLLLGSVVILTATQLYHRAGEDLINPVITSALFGLFQLFALSVAQQAIRERQLREETAALNAELISTRELLSQTTAQSERMRIARDLHDILGHHMTALTLNLEVARHHVEGSALEKVEQSLALAKLLLGDLRTTVSELREDDVIDVQRSINTLVSGLPRLDVDVDFSAALTIRDAELAETLLRCTQEALTNVLRHSSATHCSIVVAGVDELCLLTVTDNGTGNKKNDITPGNGLKGMVERVQALGGKLSWQQSERGFELRVELFMARPQ